MTKNKVVLSQSSDEYLYTEVTTVSYNRIDFYKVLICSD
jgi:hypothetical protein